MAKARMLHKKISISMQVNKLSLPVKLLFTWMIAHADDEGRLRGEPAYVKATVVPLTNWSLKKIESYLREIEHVELINWWTQKDEKFIEFIKWGEHQSIRSDRFKKSDLPSVLERSVNQSPTKQQPSSNQVSPQSNISESNVIKVNKSEYKVNEIQPVADKNPFKNEATVVINPKTYEPKTEGEVSAKVAWEKLEPYNLLAFQTTYLKALRKGLPSNLFYQFTSEINQDQTVQNKGAVFNKKVDDYFTNKGVAL